MKVVSDASPIRYLVEIGLQDFLPQLFSDLLVPSVVALELQHTNTPATVSAWIRNRPSWLQLRASAICLEPHAGERAAIELAVQEHADLVLIDDPEGRLLAATANLNIMGTVAFLAVAEQKRLLNFNDALRDLMNTSFRASEEIIEQVRRKYLRG